DVGGSIPSPPTISDWRWRLPCGEPAASAEESRWPLRSARISASRTVPSRLTDRHRSTHHSEGNKDHGRLDVCHRRTDVSEATHLARRDSRQGDGIRRREKDRYLGAAHGPALPGYVQSHPSGAVGDGLCQGRSGATCRNFGSELPGHRDDNARDQTAYRQDARTSCGREAGTAEWIGDETADGKGRRQGGDAYRAGLSAARIVPEFLFPLRNRLRHPAAQRP